MLLKVYFSRFIIYVEQRCVNNVSARSIYWYALCVQIAVQIDTSLPSARELSHWSLYIQPKLLSGYDYYCYTPPQKSGGVLCYTLRTVLSVRPSVRPSFSASFPDSNLSSFRLIFFKLCMDIDIGEEWFGIANGLNSFINNRVMALDWCKNVFSSISSEQMDQFW